MNLISPKQIGDYNKNQMLTILREGGPASRVELSRLLDISATAITRNTTKMLKNGIIRECGAKRSEIGRKPVLLELCGDFCYVLCADIVGGTIKTAIADLLGNIINYYEEPVLRSEGAYVVMEQLLALLKNIITESNVPPEKIWITVIGTPGIFDPVAGKSSLAYFLDGWEEIDIRKNVFDAISIETIIENDVNLDLKGESWKGVGRDYENILYIKLGQGLASRFVMENKLIRGVHKMAGEIGHMMPVFSNAVNYEDMLNNEVVSMQYNKLSGKNSVSTITELCHAARSGDEAAITVKRNLLDLFSLVILNSITVLDPEVIILGGDACCFEEEEISLLKKNINKHFPLSQTIIPSMLDKKACLYGAIKTGLDRVEERITGLW